MVFNSTFFITVVLIGIAIWQLLISILLIRTISHYNRITRGISKATLTDVMEAIVGRLVGIERRTEKTEQVTANLTREGLSHISKIGIVRFNPFADTGGSQSFTMALLDKKDNGIVMTSLYARSGNRWYVKEIASGTGKELELSKEEKASIEKAKRYE